MALHLIILLLLFHFHSLTSLQITQIKSLPCSLSYFSSIHFFSIEPWSYQIKSFSSFQDYSSKVQYQFPSPLGSFKFIYSILHPKIPSISCVSWSFLNSMLPVYSFLYYSLQTSMTSTFFHSFPHPMGGGVYLIILIYIYLVIYWNNSLNTLLLRSNTGESQSY